MPVNPQVWKFHSYRCHTCGHQWGGFESEPPPCPGRECEIRREMEAVDRIRSTTLAGQAENLHEAIRAVGRAIRDAFLEDTAWIQSKFRRRDGEQDD